MTPFLVCLLLGLPFVGPALSTDRADQLVADLATDSAEDAIVELCTLEPAITLPRLVACVRGADHEQAWQAARALRRIGGLPSRDRAYRSAVAELVEFVAGHTRSEARMIAALALAGFDKQLLPFSMA